VSATDGNKPDLKTAIYTPFHSSLGRLATLQLLFTLKPLVGMIACEALYSVLQSVKSLKIVLLGAVGK
jgi:hypothetical protein